LIRATSTPRFRISSLRQERWSFLTWKIETVRRKTTARDGVPARVDGSVQLEIEFRVSGHPAIRIGRARIARRKSIGLRRLAP
jgi:hypothetical protein